MGFQAGYLPKVFVGEFDLSGFFNQVSVSGNTQAVSVDTFGGADKDFIAGLRDGTVSIGGLWDNTAVSGSDVRLDALADGSQVAVTVSFQGASVIGQRAYSMNARETNYPIRSTISDAVRLNSGFQADGGVRSGVIMKEFDQETVAGNFASVDNTVATTFGSVGYLHVTDFNGTNATIKVTDSTDDAVFADHVNFTVVTGTTSERVAVAGTVNRYARCELTGTFTDITFTVAFARNQS